MQAPAPAGPTASRCIAFRHLLERRRGLQNTPGGEVGAGSSNAESSGRGASGGRREGLAEVPREHMERAGNPGPG